MAALKITIVVCVTMVMAGICWGQDAECQMADLAFVIDSSGSIRDKNPPDNSYDNYQLLKQFVIDLIDKIDIGPSATRIAATLFSSDAQLSFYLDDYNDGDEIKRAIQSLHYMGGETNTSGGLRLTRQEIFRFEKGDRPGVRNVMVLITDGESNRDEAKTINEANAVKSEDITIFVVGITDQINEEELETIASSLDKHYFTSPDIQSLNEISLELTSGVCTGPNPTPPTDACSDVDLVLVIDSSGSIRDKNPRDNSFDNYNLLTDFINSLMDRLDISPSAAHVGVVLYSSEAELIFDLNTFKDGASVKEAITNLRYMGGETNTADALKIARTQIFTQPGGDRPNVPNVVLLITDGESNVNEEDTLDEAEKLKAEKITMFVVGVTDEINEEELQAIASPPLEDHFFQSPEHRYLDTIFLVLKEGICNGGSGDLTEFPCDCSRHQVLVCFTCEASNEEECVTTGQWEACPMADPVCATMMMEDGMFMNGCQGRLHCEGNEENICGYKDSICIFIPACAPFNDDGTCVKGSDGGSREEP